ncbi:MAG: hypothetical protein A2Y78_02005 [Acidobacteria bacterium RBG_13_68_16]|nr:MAG: hypothetical protein A2Y78_02005 [Acidobacteria bacterium RBG_13_68_16]
MAGRATLLACSGRWDVATVPLEVLAHGRSGDKGEASNVGVIARNEAAYDWLRKNLTPELVKRLLGGIVKGEVERFEVPNLLAFNFILHDSLGGGGTASLLTDAQGKTHAQALLRCVVEVPDALLEGL